MKPKMIGVVGGVGSYAGLDLIRKIYDQSGASSDSEHLPIAMISEPQSVADRTAFLLGETEQNPGEAIGRIIGKLASTGANVIGIPCNTAHAAPIFDVIRQHTPSHCQLLHMIEEVGLYLQSMHPEVDRVGVLSTTGTHRSHVYPETLAAYGFDVLQVEEAIQHERVQPAIYAADYGIKAHSNPVHERAIRDLRSAAMDLVNDGAQAVILGCTEVPLALTETTIANRPLIDATAVLARALIRSARG